MRYEATKKVGILGIIGNIFLLIIKGMVGFASHSQSMIADAVNSASDIFASVMTTIGNRIARVPEDADHNFGHGKAEYLFSLFISLSMMGLSLKILFDAVISIIDKNVVYFSIPLFIVCIVTILTKLSLYLYTRKVYKKHHNLLIESNMLDHRNDCIITTFTLLSILLSYFQIYWFDGVVGFFISLWIFYTGVRLFIESYRVLMDASLSEDDRLILEKIILSHDKIQKVDEFYSVPVGYSYLVVLTIFIDGSLSTKDSHQIADHLEKEIVKKMDKIKKVIIHVNPAE